MLHLKNQKYISFSYIELYWCFIDKFQDIHATRLNIMHACPHSHTRYKKETGLIRQSKNQQLTKVKQNQAIAISISLNVKKLKCEEDCP